MDFKKAFTLVEILLTLAIVGSVAILAVTNVTNSSDEATRIAKLRSTYSLLNAAYNKALAENGENRYYFEKSILNYLKLSKACYYMTETQYDGCFKKEAQKGKAINLPPISENDDGLNSAIRTDKAILANGASVADAGGMIYVDVDGPNKGNNTFGDDIFGFNFSIDGGFIPLGINAKFSTTSEGCPYYGDLCTAWALKMGNTDYLKCPGDLAWNNPAKVKCPK